MCCWLNKELELTPRPAWSKTVHVCCIYLLWIRCTLWTYYIKSNEVGSCRFCIVQPLCVWEGLGNSEASWRPKADRMGSVFLVERAVCATWDWCFLSGLCSVACIWRSGGTGRRHGTSSRPCVRSQLTNSGSPPNPPEARSRCGAPSQLWHTQQPIIMSSTERKKV